LVDGNKISIRKILYSAFKRNLTKEVKVAQFSGYVSEHSGYHHGEQSLVGAIIGMACEYTGTNNISNLKLKENKRKERDLYAATIDCGYYCGYSGCCLCTSECNPYHSEFSDLEI